MDVAITGGHVVPVDGNPVEGGTVLIRDGRIAAVGPAEEVEIPDEVTEVDAAGCWVLPGFIESHAHVGVHEDGEAWAGNDTNEMTDPNGARFRAIDAINPADVGFADALSGGVTSAIIKPGSGNPIGGATVAVKTWGRSVDEMAFRTDVSVKSALGENPKRVYGEKDKTPSTRLGVAAILREAFTKAQDYRAKREHDSRAGQTVRARPHLRDPGPGTGPGTALGPARAPRGRHRHRDPDRRRVRLRTRRSTTAPRATWSRTCWPSATSR